MPSRLTASRPRCAAVAGAATSLLLALAAVLAEAALDAPQGPPTAGGPLVRLCLGAIALVALWAWVQALAGVADAWRGASPVGSGVVRRLATAACGVALVTAATAVGAPSQADPGGGQEVLAGLPLPERAEAPDPAPEPRSTVVVEVGDSLWSIAAHELGAAASDAEVSVRWRAVHAANEAVIGPDPDLIEPGQVLELPEEKP